MNPEITKTTFVHKIVNFYAGRGLSSVLSARTRKCPSPLGVRAEGPFQIGLVLRGGLLDELVEVEGLLRRGRVEVRVPHVHAQRVREAPGLPSRGDLASVWEGLLFIPSGGLIRGLSSRFR